MSDGVTEIYVYNKNYATADYRAIQYSPDVKLFAHCEDNISAGIVKKGLYEGGDSLWECSMDLLVTLDEYRDIYISDSTTICELGCGHGLPGIYALLIDDNIKLLFQDLNASVLETTTIPNVLMTVKQNKGLTDTETVELVRRRCRFIAGDWSNPSLIKAIGKQDLIISSEGIYRPDSFDPFCSIIDRCMSKHAIVVAKRFYFGIGGGTLPFTSFIEAGAFQLKINIIKEINNGRSNIRDILLINKL